MHSSLMHINVFSQIHITVDYRLENNWYPTTVSGVLLDHTKDPSHLAFLLNADGS